MKSKTNELLLNYFLKSKNFTEGLILTEALVRIINLKM